MRTTGAGVGLVGAEFVVMHEPAVVTSSRPSGYVDWIVNPLTLQNYYSEVPQVLMTLRRKVALIQ